MPEADLLAALHSTVNSYLSTLEAAAHAMAAACPEIGKPYGQRLSRLRARLAFDSSAPKIEEGRATTERELADYARKTRDYTEQRCAEFQRALIALEKIVRTLAERQVFYGERLRRTAAQIEKQHSAEAAERQSAALLSCAESMGHEAQSLVRKMSEELGQVETRLAGLEITDPATGLINRREMERSIRAAEARGETPVLLLFEFRCEPPSGASEGLPGDTLLDENLPDEKLPDEVARQAGARLTSQFRHHDLIARWSEWQFLVLFQGRREIAQARTPQILRWVTGRYPLSDGSFFDTSVEASLIDGARLAEPELTPA